MLGNVPQVGYQVFHEDGLHGARGLYYNYILAGNGLFIVAESPLLTGRTQISETQVRGLPDLVPMLQLAQGKISGLLLENALNALLDIPDVETYICVVYKNGDYHLKSPQQKGSAGSVEYERLDNVVLDLHSHGGMKAFFSSQDNRDEQGLRLYGVIGNPRGVLHMKMRLGIYGYFGPVKWENVFDGPSSVVDKSFDDDIPD